MFYGSNRLVKFMGDDYGSDFTETNFMSILGVVILVSVYD